MRNFRTAAVATATALTVALGGVTVATAETTDGETSTESTYTPHPSRPKEETNNDVELINETDQAEGTDTPSDNNEGKSKASTKIGAGLGAYDKDGATAADGEAIFGSDKTGFGEQPGWAKAFYALTVFSAVSAFIGLVVGPAYNFVVHGMPNL